MAGKTEPELWRRLKVGDRIRMIEIPLDFLDWKNLQRDTRQAYKYLSNRVRPLTVSWIDDDGFPWVAFRFRAKNGPLRKHWMAMNHGGIAIVRRRKTA